MNLKKILGTPREYGYLLIGNLGFALAFDLFLAGNELSSGGFSGLGLVVNHFMPFFSVGAIVFFVSVPIFIWSFFVEGIRYTLSALVSTAALSIMIDVLDFLPTLTDNRLLAAICGGALFGFSSYVMIRGRISGSGTDLLARLLVTRFRRMSLGSFLLICDAVIVLFSVLAFGDIETGIYSGFAIAVSAFILDELVRGLNRAFMFQIITSVEPKELAKVIDDELGRGSTLVPSYGMYRGDRNNILIVVVDKHQIYEMKDIIKKVDPKAFAIMISVSEIIGEGFEGVDVTEPMREKEN